MFPFLELPKEIPEKDFEEFLNKVSVDFPTDKFPEIFVQYYKTGEKVIVLGVGKSAECAEQTTHSVEEIPSLKLEVDTGLDMDYILIGRDWQEGFDILFKAREISIFDR